MTPLEILRQLNELDERPRIEAKTGSDMGKSILETVCAFSNEPGMGGGWLLLGAAPDEQAFWPQYEVIGVANLDKLQADLTTQCAHTFNIPIRPQMEVAEIQGNSLVSEERWGDPGSVTRNPHLASVLHEINFAETKGSGIRVMRELMRQSNLTAPTFESDRQKDLFVTTFLFHHFLGADDWEWLNSLTLQGLGDEEARALVFVRETLSIDNAAYRDLNQVDVLNASTHLRRLRDQGLLEQRGKGSATYYIPTPRFLTTLPGQKAEGKPMPGKKPIQLPPGTIPDNCTTIPDSDPSGGKSSKPSPLSSKPKSKSSKLDDTALLVSELPPLLQSRVGLLGKKPAADTLRLLISDLCAWRPLSAAEIAFLLDRTRDHLLNEHIRPMVASGELLPTLPDQPKHPRQAYRASGKGGAA